MWSLLVEPFVEFDFLRRGLIEALVLGAGFAVVGTWLVARRLSLIGDTLSHAMLPGVVIAFSLFGLQPMALFFGGWLTGWTILLAAFFLFRHRPDESDSALALFAVFSIALGILIASRTRTTTEILHLLFGNLLAIDRELLVVTASLAALTWLVVIWRYREILIALVDPAHLASVKPISKGTAVLGLGLFAAHLTVGFAALGAMTTDGLLIVPALVGRAYGRSLVGSMGLAVVFAGLASYAGLLLSYHGGLPVGPAIVTVASGAFGFLRLVGLLAGRPRRRI